MTPKSNGAMEKCTRATKPKARVTAYATHHSRSWGHKTAEGPISGKKKKIPTEIWLKTSIPNYSANWIFQRARSFRLLQSRNLSKFPNIVLNFS